MWIVFLILATAILGGIGAMLFITVPISKRVYKQQLVRTSKDMWGRCCSAPDNQEQMDMWNQGCEWAEKNSHAAKEVKIFNDGLNLYGEYYDFGSEKCVVILPGRCESLMYSYYFAQPYQRAGYNVLVIDNRAHGKSDGTHSTIGRKESGDVIAWVNFLEKNFNIKKVCLHCICIGSASGFNAVASKNCPSIIKEIVTEGCFVNFRETFKEHMICDNRPVYPVCDLVMLLIWLNTGTNVYICSPIRKIRKDKIKTLFLHTKLDKFSKPEKAVKLFNKCKSPAKKIVWFEKGGHSHIRINNRDMYDNAIIDFLSEE